MLLPDPPVSPAALLRSKPSLRTKKNRSLITNPVFLMFVLLNVWFMVLLSIGWAKELDSTVPKKDNTCSIKGYRVSTNAIPILALISLFLSQISIYIHLLLLETDHVVQCLVFGRNVVRKRILYPGSTKDDQRSRSLNRNSIVAFCFFTLLTLSLLLVLTVENLVCAAMGTPLHPSVHQLLSMIVLLVFLLASLLILHCAEDSTKWVALTEKDLKDYYACQKECDRFLKEVQFESIEDYVEFKEEAEFIMKNTLALNV